MATNHVIRPSGPNYLRWAGRILALAAAVFWLWLGVGFAYMEGFSWGSLLAHCVHGLLILIATLVAWKWEGVGGSLLIGVAILVTVPFLWAILPVIRAGYQYQVNIMPLLTIALPSLVAGFLFLASWRREGNKSRLGQ